MPQVKHVVLMRFRTDAIPSAIDEVFADLATLKDSIPGMIDFSGGPYSSPEGLNKGFTHGFVMTFADAAARDSYLPHPEHEKVKIKIVSLLEGGIEGVVAFDWERENL